MTQIKVGDRVRITIGPPDKVGRTGEVITLAINGAIIKLSDNHFTPIKFKHLEVIKDEK